MFHSIKTFLQNHYLVHYTGVPKGTGKIIPLIVIESLVMSISYLISIYLVNSLHFTPIEVGKLISMISLGTGLGSILTGYLTTKISVTRVSAFGILLYAVGFFLLSVVTSYQYLLGVLFLCGVSGVCMMIGNLTALIKLTNTDAMKNRIIVLQSVVFNLCFSVSSFFMSYFHAQALRNLFLIFAVLLLVAGLLVCRISPGSTTASKNSSLGSMKANLACIGLIASIISCYGILYSLIKINFPVETVTRYSNPFNSWLLLSINPLMIILFQPLLIGMLKNKGNLFLLVNGALLLGLGYTLFGLSSYLLLSIFFVILATIGEMLFSPISKKIAATSLGEGNEGMGLALWKTSYYFSGVLGAIFVGYLGENFKSLNIWLICLPLSASLILCVLAYNYYWRRIGSIYHS